MEVPDMKDLPTTAIVAIVVVTAIMHETHLWVQLSGIIVVGVVAVIRVFKNGNGTK